MLSEEQQVAIATAAQHKLPKIKKVFAFGKESIYLLHDLDIHLIRTDKVTWNLQKEENERGCKIHLDRFRNELDIYRQEATAIYRSIVWEMLHVGKVFPATKTEDAFGKKNLKIHTEFVATFKTNGRILDIDEYANGAPYENLEDIRKEISRIKILSTNLKEFTEQSKVFLGQLRDSTVKNDEFTKKAFDKAMEKINTNLEMNIEVANDVNDVSEYRQGTLTDGQQDHHDVPFGMKEAESSDDNESPSESSSDAGSGLEDGNTGHGAHDSPTAAPGASGQAQPEEGEVTGGTGVGGANIQNLSILPMPSPTRQLFGASPSNPRPTLPTTSGNRNTEAVIAQAFAQAAHGNQTQQSGLTNLIRSVSIAPLESLKPTQVKAWLAATTTLPAYTQFPVWGPYVTTKVQRILDFAGQAEPQTWGCWNQMSLGKFRQTLELQVLRTQDEKQATTLSQAFRGVTVVLDKYNLTTVGVAQALESALERAETFAPAIQEMEKTSQGQKQVQDMLHDLLLNGRCTKDQTQDKPIPGWNNARLNETKKLRQQVSQLIKLRAAKPKNDPQYVGTSAAFFVAASEEICKLADGFTQARGVYEELAGVGVKHPRTEYNDDNTQKKPRIDNGERILCDKCGKMHKGGAAQCWGTNGPPWKQNTAAVGQGNKNETKPYQPPSKPSLGSLHNSSVQNKVITKQNVKLHNVNKVFQNKHVRSMMATVMNSTEVSEEEKDAIRALTTKASKKVKKASSN